MNLSIFKIYTAANDWSAIAPEIMLSLSAISLLIFDILIFNKKSNASNITIIAISIVFIISLLNLANNTNIKPFYCFSGLLRQDIFTQFMRLFFLISSFLTAYFSNVYLRKYKIIHTEYYVILLIVTAAIMLAIQSNDFIMLFISLETSAIGFYILITYFKDECSLKSGLKYLILSGISAAIMLFGIILLYGIAGSQKFLPATSVSPFNYDIIQYCLSFNSNITLNYNIKNYFHLSSLFVLCGIFFKIGVVPFQVWIPEVYKSVSTPITALLNVSSKISGIFILLNLIQGPFKNIVEFITPLLSFIAITTIIYGNFAALSERNVKCLIGLSGITQTGYMLLGIISFIKEQSYALPILLFYFLAYLLGSFSVFSVIIYNSKSLYAFQEVKDFKGFSSQEPFLAIVLTVGLCSLGGIPPFIGFISKFLIIILAYKANVYPVLLIVVFLGIVLSTYYYFNWIREIFFSTWQNQKNNFENKEISNQIKLNFLDYIILTILVLLILILGVYQGPIGKYITSYFAQ